MASLILAATAPGVGSDPTAQLTAAWINETFKPVHAGYAWIDRVHVDLFAEPSVRDPNCVSDGSANGAICSFNVEWHCRRPGTTNDHTSIAWIEQRVDHFNYTTATGWSRGESVEAPELLFLKDDAWVPLQPSEAPEFC